MTILNKYSGKLSLQGALVIIILLTFQNCVSKNSKSILIDKNTRAEGQLINDSVFDGLVKFYNIKTGKLLKEENFKNGVLNGPYLEFYTNGNVAIRFQYVNGLINGLQYLYDTSGQLASQNFYYYGLRVGDGIKYKNNEIEDYSFYSLDNKLLFHISYDSIKQKKITDLERNFFFCNRSEYQVIDSMHLSQSFKDYFLYLPNPPKFKFEYSLVEVDSSLKIKKEISKFSTKYPWTVFDKPEIAVDKNNLLALQIIITDTNKVIGKAHLLKKLD